MFNFLTNLLCNRGHVKWSIKHSCHLESQLKRTQLHNCWLMVCLKALMVALVFCHVEFFVKFSLLGLNMSGACVSTAALHGQWWDSGGATVQATGSGGIAFRQERRWTWQHLCPQVPWCCPPDQRPDALLHHLPFLRAEEPTAARKPQLHSR